jgi:hypothetical protein
MARSGYWRDDDGTPMRAAEAWTIWGDHAYGLLVDTARIYHAVITYGELGSRVQESSGVRTSALLHNWIGPVLGKVVHKAHRLREPPLTALVVHGDDGMVGVGYKEVLQVAGLQPLDDDMAREEHAAVSRLQCYRHFGADLPDGHGVPALAPRLQAALDRRRSRQELAPRPTCPSCFIQLPTTGQCDSCGHRGRAQHPV